VVQVIEKHSALEIDLDGGTRDDLRRSDPLDRLAALSARIAPYSAEASRRPHLSGRRYSTALRRQLD